MADSVAVTEKQEYKELLSKKRELGQPDIETNMKPW